MSLLESIDGPEDLRGLSEQELAQLAQEVREHIIDTVGEIGGHFGANLGTCELAVALHSVLESPKDKILWDVGHQAYPHKVLTGRRDQLSTIRQYGGLAPFCSIAESLRDRAERRKAAVLADRAELVASAGEDLVRVSLMADVPQDLVLGRLEHRVQRYRQLARAEIRAEVPADLTDRVDDVLAHLLRELCELLLG